MSGKAAREHAAHLNSFEAFPQFATGIVIAALSKAPPASVDGVAVAFVMARVVYVWRYVSDVATLRSLVWMTGLGLSIALFVMAAAAR